VPRRTICAVGSCMRSRRGRADHPHGGGRTAERARFLHRRGLPSGGRESDADGPFHEARERLDRLYAKLPRYACGQDGAGASRFGGAGGTDYCRISARLNRGPPRHLATNPYGGRAMIDHHCQHTRWMAWLGIMSWALCGAPAIAQHAKGGARVAPLRAVAVATGSTAGTTQPPVSDQLCAYPKNGQSSEQQAKDRPECAGWSWTRSRSTSSGYVPIVRMR
jgi:hypothetical protein